MVVLEHFAPEKVHCGHEPSWAPQPAVIQCPWDGGLREGHGIMEHRDWFGEFILSRPDIPDVSGCSGGYEMLGRTIVSSTVSPEDKRRQA